MVKIFIEMGLQQLFFKWQLLKQQDVIVRSASATPYFISILKIFCPFQINLTITALATRGLLPLPREGFCPCHARASALATRGLLPLPREGFCPCR
jgi:hypothetical protein